MSEPRLITRPFVAVTGAVLVFFLYVGVLVPLVPMYVEDELGNGELGVGLALASFAVAAISARPLIGRLIERHGRRAVMMGGAAVAAAAGSLYGFADALPLLLVLRGLTGAGEAALFVAAATLVADLAPANRQAEAASYYSVAVYGGIGLGPMLGDAVQSATTFRLAFVVAAGCAVVASLLSALVPARVPLHTQPPAEPLAEQAGAAALGELVPPDRRRFVHPAALGPGLVLASGVAAFATFSAFLPEHATSLGLSGSGRVFALYSVVCLLVRIFGARLPERLGPRVAVTCAFTLLGSGLGLLAGVAEVWALWVAAVGVGLGSAFLYPSLMALTVSRASDVERPRAIASFTMFFEIGMAFGGLALGGVADVFTKRAGFAVAVVVCGAGAWLMRALVVPSRDRAVTPAVPAYTPVVGD